MQIVENPVNQLNDNGLDFDRRTDALGEPVGVERLPNDTIAGVEPSTHPARARLTQIE